MENIFLILGVAIIVATLIGYIANRLKQPLVLAYIITGFLMGPHALGIIKDVDPVMVLSEMGIAFLLFTVGLNLEMKHLKELGPVAVVTGMGQVIVMTLAGFLISQYFGFSVVSSIYIGIALAFSSTIIIVKLLAEKGELNSLHGRISIGFLIVQDFVAIIALIMANGLGKGDFLTGLSNTFVKAFIFIVIVAVITRYVVKPVFDSMAKQQELLFMSSISYCFLLAISSYLLGLSLETGAFLAGISLATLPYNSQVIGRIKPLRDFFIVIFFITLGTEMAFSLSSEIIWPLISLSLLVLLGTPLILLIVMGSMGYRKRTAFLVGITVAQISEFSLILVALGYSLEHIPRDVLSLVTAVGVITITVSAYMITYGHQMYYKLEKYLGIFQKNEPLFAMQDMPAKNVTGHIVVVGYHRVGYGIVKKLRELHKKLVVVDFDPDIIRNLMKQGIPCVYGDVGDPEIQDRVNLKHAEIVISTTPDLEDDLTLLKSVKEINKDAVVMIVADHVEEALELYENGADYVILPHLLGGHHASLLLEDITADYDRLLATKIAHIKELRDRKDVHPFHGHNRK